VIHPVPPGTRDILPEEMRELRALSTRLLSVFEQSGYGEVSTPTLEYEDVLRRGDERAAGAGFRAFDEHGNILALRSDSTIPIARLVAGRLADRPLPLRLCYFEHAYRPTRIGSGQPREFLQGGIELIGERAPAGDAEVVALVVEALSAAGLRRHRVGIGDGSLYRRLLVELEVPRDAQDDLLDLLTKRDLVGLEARVAQLKLARDARDLLVRIPTLRGGREILEGADGPAATATDNLRACVAEIEKQGLADRVIVDLSLLRDLGYYTGAVFEVLDPAVGFALGGGGRYDDLLGRFGLPLPACGIALDIHRVHIAQLDEGRVA
jgi:ATP phosphoribosyltransferase regulatory subunit